MAEDKTVQLSINTIRTFSIDPVQAVKPGHPGTPMALAPLGWDKTALRHTSKGDERKVRIAEL